ncbi:MAG: M67 family metallopeptidase [Acidimicrobiia bacterium]|nr:M67 family metallopeptidase [Acidimicrobiia bacterium]
MILARAIIEAMVNHARFWAPEESCGLLAGDADFIRMAYCLTNVERSRVRFTVSPAEHYRAMLHAERSGWSIRGSFHSHPVSRAIPSPADIAGALDPEWLYCIVGLSGAEPDVGAFRIVDGEVSEVAIEAVASYS